MVEKMAFCPPLPPPGPLITATGLVRQITLTPDWVIKPLICSHTPPLQLAGTSWNTLEVTIHRKSITSTSCLWGAVLTRTKRLLLWATASSSSPFLSLVCFLPLFPIANQWLFFISRKVTLMKNRKRIRDLHLRQESWCISDLGESACPHRTGLVLRRQQRCGLSLGINLICSANQTNGRTHLETGNPCLWQWLTSVCHFDQWFGPPVALGKHFRSSPARMGLPLKCNYATFCQHC